MPMNYLAQCCETDMNRYGRLALAPELPLLWVW
jgi:hypothetical protein